MFENRKGFTLIELLIVVVIIGILAAIALPKFGSTREAAYFSTLKADLNNLRSAQEVYYTTGSYAYTSSLDDLDFSESSGSNVTLTITGTSQGYGAYATHDALDSTEGCALYYGDATTVASAPTDITLGNNGVIACSD